MTFRTPDVSKLAKSAAIVGIALAFVVGLRFLFPGFDWNPTLTAILTGISAWLVNTVKETLDL